MKIITDVITEPLTIAQVKAHVRLDSGSIEDNVTTAQSIKPASYGISNVSGVGIDVLGYSALVNLNVGTCAGTLTVKVQESDDNINFTDYATFTAVTSATDDTVYEKAYSGTKQYIRAYASVTVGACVFSVDIVKYAATSTEDTQLTKWIKAAREYGEDYTGHAFAPQTWEFYLDKFPCRDNFELPKTPLTSVTSLKYKDSAGTETTMTANTDYIVDADSQPGKIFLPYGLSWPSFVEYPNNPISVTAVVGYTGTAPYILPHNFVQAMLVHIGLMYKHRDTEIPDMKTVHRLYDMRRRWQF